MSTVEDLVKRISIEGWCVVDGVIPPDEVVKVRDSLIATAEGRPERPGPMAAIALRGLIAYDQAIAPVPVRRSNHGRHRSVFRPATSAFP